MFVYLMPILNLANKVKSFYSNTFMESTISNMLYKKTIDADSSAAVVFLVHKDKFEVDKNLNFLRSVEKNAYSINLNDNLSDIELKDDETYLNEVKPVINQAYVFTTCLFITDQFINDLNLLQTDLKHIDDLAYLNQLKGYKDYIESITHKKVNTYLYSILDKRIVNIK